MEKIPRNEQETIITFDVDLNEWRFYSDYPPHIRKWRDKVIADREEHYQDGTEKMLDGVINGSVSVRGKKVLTDEQRKEFADRMQQTRIS